MMRRNNLWCAEGYKLTRYWLVFSCVLFMTPIGFFLVSKKRFDKHPYPMMGWAILAQANQYYNSISMQIYFTLQLNRWAVWPLFIIDLSDIEGQSYLETDWELRQRFNNFDFIFSFNRIMKDLSYYTELLLNVMLIIDLYFMLVNPFKPRRSRLIWYKIIWAIPTLSLFGYYVWFYYTPNGPGSQVQSIRGINLQALCIS